MGAESHTRQGGDGRGRVVGVDFFREMIVSVRAIWSSTLGMTAVQDSQPPVGPRDSEGGKARGVGVCPAKVEGRQH